jgi:MEMO1 family protein
MTATRDPAVSGAFYPNDPRQLQREVRQYLDGARAPRDCAAVVAPHAGYMYSGRTAGLVLGACAIPSTCIILAPNHTGRLGAPGGASALLSRAYRTPLGVPRTDVALGNAVAEAAGGLVADDAAAHAREHAIEVILPFLQTLNPDVSIVPIVIAWSDWQRSARLASAIAEAVGQRRDVLVVASSDMNHYESAKVSEPKDRAALANLLTLDGEGLLETTRRLNVTMCGRVPAAIACEYARLRGRSGAELVDYRHSGLVNGDVEHVVGYAGVLLGLTG